MQTLSVFISERLLLTYGFATALLLLSIVEYLRLRRNRVAINAQQAVTLINRQNAAVIDIRNPDAYKQGHIIDSLGKEITGDNKKLEKLKKRPIIIVCNTGVESQKMAAQLLNQGYNAFSLQGGMRAWVDAELPVIKG